MSNLQLRLFAKRRLQIRQIIRSQESVLRDIQRSPRLLSLQLVQVWITRGPGKGDVRYVPYNWKVINTNSWSCAPYTAAFGITKAGTYTLTVVFDRQMYNGKEWENTGEQDTKQVNFNITQAQTVTATPTPQPNGATAKSAVKTGDTTNIAPFVIILVIAAGCIAGVVV